MLNSRQEAVLSAVLMMAGLLPFSAKAHDFFSFDEEQLIYTLHTHLYASSTSLPSFQEFQIASVCFISDTEDCSGYLFGNTEDLIDGDPEDYNPDDDERCKKEGYLISSCPEGYKPGGLKCPYGDYYTKCVPTCPSNYVECTEPYFGVGEACDGKYASCDCTPCGAGYTYTSIPNGYLQDGEGCLDCDGVTKYKIKINPCDGFLDCGDMGGAAGAKTCQSGDLIKYDNCKPCPNKGKYTTCPTGAVCEYEECSGLWYITDCQSGYEFDSTKTNCVCSGVDWCTLTSSCTALGYKQQTCNGASIKCPLDTNYSFCIEQCSPDFQYTCSGTGYAGGKGTTCGGKYTECICASGYAWENGNCVQAATWGQCTGYAGKNCNIGDVLFSDGTCNAGKVSGKTPIAVVVYISSEGCGQALALNDLDATYQWGGYGTDISGLTNYSSLSNASADFASCENSKIIMADGDKSIYPAVWAAHEYSTEGTSAGDWCLPALGVFSTYNSNSSIIDRGFSWANGKTFPSNIEIWSSSESSYHSVWETYLGEPYATSYKSSSRAVRPVIEF